LNEDGLIRPSAEGEAAAHINEVEGSGMIYVDWRTGDVLRAKFASLGRKGPGQSTIKVEILGLDGQVPQDDGLHTGAEDYNDQMEDDEAGTASREGRVGIGEWPIWNLRIVDIT
jgi:hypothetical protein